MDRNEALSRRNLYDELIAMRDEQRERRRNAIHVIAGDELPWELNRQGKMRWYLHPKLDDVGINTQIFYVQEIPPGSRSGRQHTQGGELLYVWAGRGYTVLDGVEHHWEAGDLINLPILTGGIDVQHFNIDPDEPARLVQTQANFSEMISVDMGSGFEQLEDAPEYGAQSS
jgi:hypothetical protein